MAIPIGKIAIGLRHQPDPWKMAGEEERTPVPSQTPTFRRLLLGQRLREARTSAGLTAKAVSTSLEVAPSWVTRIENGERGIQLRDLRRLCDLYGVQDPQIREHLLDLARQAKTPGWWAPYQSTLPPRYTDYIGLESAASRVRNAELVVIPGLLQTEDYARELLLHGMHDFTPEEVESRIEVRLRRQDHLLDRSDVHLDVILDESVLHRVVGDSAIMRKQVAHIRSCADRDNVTIRVLPLSDGVHSGSSGSVVILDFAAEAMAPVPYVETVAGDLYLEKGSDIEVCIDVWNYMAERALDAPESARLLTQITHAYEKRP